MEGGGSAGVPTYGTARVGARTYANQGNISIYQDKYDVVEEEA